MNKKVLIIGGAGYIGNIIVRELLYQKYNVVSLDLFLYNNNSCVTQFCTDKRFSFFYGDMRSRETLDQALEGVTDVVILAGLVGDPVTKKYPAEASAINDNGILSCIDTLNGRGLDRVVFISTCSNYGLIRDNEAADEGFELKPLSLYSKSKVAAEKYLLSLDGSVDYAPTILRFATAFGLAPRMRFDLTVNEFTRELVSGRELLVFDAETWRPYCHVQDFARLVQMVLEAPRASVEFEVFNAGGEMNNFTKHGIVDLILKYVPTGKVRYEQKGADPRNYRVNFQKVKKVLGFEPNFTVEDGIRELKNAIEQHVFDRVEEMRNFYGNYEIKYPMV